MMRVEGGRVVTIKKQTDKRYQSTTNFPHRLGIHPNTEKIDGSVWPCPVAVRTALVGADFADQSVPHPPDTIGSRQARALALKVS